MCVIVSDYCFSISVLNLWTDTNIFQYLISGSQVAVIPFSVLHFISTCLFYFNISISIQYFVYCNASLTRSDPCFAQCQHLFVHHFCNHRSMPVARWMSPNEIMASWCLLVSCLFHVLLNNWQLNIFVVQYHISCPNMEAVRRPRKKTSKNKEKCNESSQPEAQEETRLLD